MEEPEISGGDVRAGAGTGVDFGYGDGWGCATAAEEGMRCIARLFSVE
jgi:hypothetical protein